MSDVKSWESVCPSKEMVANLGVRALLGEAQVAIFKVNESFYAIDAIDPFTSAAVLSRGIVGDLDGQVVVASPIYKQHFNLESGACLEDDTVTVKVYPVREEGGFIQLGIC